MIVTGPYQTREINRDSSFKWGVTLYEPNVSSETKTFPTREEAQGFFLDYICAEFEAATPDIDIWKRYPHISENEDQLTNTWACESVSRQFVRFLHARGIDAQLVHAEDAELPMADYHWWARVGDVDFDWTARQFENLEHPPAPEHQDLPCPLIWTANGRHPVVGAYERLTIHDPEEATP